jgi:hypothetical protein
MGTTKKRSFPEPSDPDSWDPNVAEEQLRLNFEAIRRVLRALWDVPTITASRNYRAMRPCMAPLDLDGPREGAFLSGPARAWCPHRGESSKGRTPATGSPTLTKLSLVKAWGSAYSCSRRQASASSTSSSWPSIGKAAQEAQRNVKACLPA